MENVLLHNARTINHIAEACPIITYNSGLRTSQLVEEYSDKSTYRIKCKCLSGACQYKEKDNKWIYSASHYSWHTVYSDSKCTVTPYSGVRQWWPQTMTATNNDHDGHKPQRPQTMTMMATNHDDQRHKLVKFIQRCREFGDFLKVHRYGEFFTFSLLWSSWYTLRPSWYRPHTIIIILLHLFKFSRWCMLKKWPAAGKWTKVFSYADLRKLLDFAHEVVKSNQIKIHVCLFIALHRIWLFQIRPKPNLAEFRNSNSAEAEAEFGWNLLSGQRTIRQW